MIQFHPIRVLPPPCHSDWGTDEHMTQRGPIQSQQELPGKTSLFACVAKPGQLEAITSHLQGVCVGGSNTTEPSGLGMGDGTFPQRKVRCSFQKQRECGLGWSKQQMVIPDVITRRFQELG